MNTVTLIGPFIVCFKVINAHVLMNVVPENFLVCVSPRVCDLSKGVIHHSFPALNEG